MPNTIPARLGTGAPRTGAPRTGAPRTGARRRRPVSRARSALLGASLALACAARPPSPLAPPGSPAAPSPPPAREGLPPLTPREAALRADLRRITEHLASEIGERNPSRKWQLADAIDFVALELEAAGLSVSREGYDLDGETVAQNLVGEVPGGAAREQIVVVAAHLDSAPGSPGAGAATGVAALITVARRLRAAAPARTLRFVVFSLCEGVVAETEAAGSRVFARAAAARGERLLASVALDSLGRFAAPGARRPPPELQAEWPAGGDFLALVAAARDRAWLDQAADAFAVGASIPAVAVIANGPVPELGATDAWGFSSEGIPALRVTDLARLRDPAHGSPEDLPERIDFDRLARATVGLESLILALSRAEGPGAELRTDPATGRVLPAGG